MFSCKYISYATLREQLLNEKFISSWTKQRIVLKYTARWNGENFVATSANILTSTRSVKFLIRRVFSI